MTNIPASPIGKDKVEYPISDSDFYILEEIQSSPPSRLGDHLSKLPYISKRHRSTFCHNPKIYPFQHSDKTCWQYCNFFSKQNHLVPSSSWHWVDRTDTPCLTECFHLVLLPGYKLLVPLLATFKIWFTKGKSRAFLKQGCLLSG